MRSTWKKFCYSTILQHDSNMIFVLGRKGETLDTQASFLQVVNLWAWLSTRTKTNTVQVLNVAKHWIADIILEMWAK